MNETPTVPGYVVTRVVALATVALAASALLFLAGLAVGAAGGSPRAPEEAVTLPDWFLPIWDAYGRDPAITPWFDFASQYAPPAPRG